MNNKQPNNVRRPEKIQIREQRVSNLKKSQHFERIAIGNALSEIEQEAELRYAGR